MGYIQKSKVRGLVKEAGMNIARDVNDAVDAVVVEAVKGAVEKAKAAGRKTVKGADFGVALAKAAEPAPQEAPADGEQTAPEGEQEGGQGEQDGGQDEPTAPQDEPKPEGGGDGQG